MAIPPVANLDPACQSCSGRALARAVEIKNGLRTIQYQCEPCGHVSYVTGPAPSPNLTWNGVPIDDESSRRVIVRIPLDE
jgi:hypothetical protein